jgi:hypothetical protein
MSTWSSRANSIFSYFGTALFFFLFFFLFPVPGLSVCLGVVMTVLIVANVATTYWSNPNIEVSLV